MKKISQVFDFKRDKWIEVPTNEALFKYSRMYSVTPQWARSVLETRNTKNREVRQSSLRPIKRDFIRGSWRVVHQGIAFDWDGILIDGQHRLMVCAETNKSFVCLVTFGLDPEAREIVDCHKPRSDWDAQNIKAKQEGKKLGVTRLHTTIERVLLLSEGVRPDMIAKDERLELLGYFVEAAAFAISSYSQIKGGQKLIAPIIAAVARAWYSYKDDQGKLDRLRDFMKIMKTGQYSDISEDDAAYSFREWYLRNKGSVRQEVVLNKAQFAIQQFMSKKELPKRRSVPAENTYQLPQSIKDTFKVAIELGALTPSLNVGRVQQSMPIPEWKDYYESKIMEVLAGKKGKCSLSYLKTAMSVYKRSEEVQDAFLDALKHLVSSERVKQFGEKKNKLSLLQ